MITYEITKKGRYAIISPIPVGILASTLDKYTSYERLGAEFLPKREWAWVHLYSIKRGIVAWGLIDVIKNVFDKYKEVYKDIDYIIKYDIPDVQKDIVWNKILRYYQRDAILAIIKNNGQIACLPTGAGKSMLVIEYLKIMKKKSLVVVTTLDIKRQWIEWIGDNDLIDVKNYQMTGLKNIMKDYDIVVYDECHRVAARTIYSLAMNTKTDAIVVGVSATPYREDKEDLRIQAALGNIVYRIDRRKLIDEGFLSDAKVFYVKTKYVNDGKYMDYSEVYKTNITDNKERNLKICELATKEAANKKRVLVLVTQIEHGNNIFDILKNFSYKSIFINGSSKERDINYMDYDIIIASNIWNEGVNLPSMDVLVIAAGGQSSIQLTQRVGRVLRKSDGKSHAIIYDFVDTPKYLSKHHKKRREVLSEDFEVFDYDT